MTALFGEADERSLRMMNRRDLRRALLSQKKEIAALTEQEPLFQRVLRNLEHVDLGTISKVDLQ
jgi:hypothetical protein